LGEYGAIYRTTETGRTSVVFGRRQRPKPKQDRFPLPPVCSWFVLGSLTASGHAEEHSPTGLWYAAQVSREELSEVLGLKSAWSHLYGQDRCVQASSEWLIRSRSDSCTYYSRAHIIKCRRSVSHRQLISIGRTTRSRKSIPLIRSSLSTMQLAAHTSGVAQRTLNSQVAMPGSFIGVAQLPTTDCIADQEFVVESSTTPSEVPLPANFSTTLPFT
jgi:hypothetical protein